MSIGKKLRILNYVLFSVVFLLIAAIVFTAKNQISLNESYENRYKSYEASVELSNSSESLTRLARTYVATQDPIYEKKYFEILDIRNGIKERPDGRKISLRKIMEGLGFTDAEFKKLKEAEDRSGSLALVEEEAMNAIKGLYKDSSGQFTVKKKPDEAFAKKLMYGQAYTKAKSSILTPIQEFEKMLNERTKEKAQEYKTRGNQLLFLIGFLSLLISGLIVSTNSNVKKVLEKIVSELSQTVDRSKKVSDNINDQTISLSQATEQQAAAAQETSSTVDEISAMVSRNLEHAEVTSEKSSESFSATERGQETVRTLKETIVDVEQSNNVIMRDVLSSNEEMAKIVEVIRGISAKTEVINDIVFQTKLLSFNASVEAARAGEHGKGFAVVAEEVGALSEMSGKAANEISEILNESLFQVEAIVSKTNESIDRLEKNSSEKISKSVEMAVKCEESLVLVVDNVKQVRDLMGQVKLASTEQVDGVKNINIAISEIENGTQLTSKSAKEIDMSSDFLKKEFSKIESVVNELRKEVLGADRNKKVA